MKITKRSKPYIEINTIEELMIFTVDSKTVKRLKSITYKLAIENLRNLLEIKSITITELKVKIRKCFMFDRSILKPLFWISRGYTSEEAIKHIHDLQSSNCKKVTTEKRKESSPMCKQYWIKKGFSEIDAALRVSERNAKYSIFSKDCDVYDGMSETEKKLTISKIQSSNGKKSCIYRPPENDTTKIEYYTSRGASIEEAKIKLKERQTTFSLEKCIIKYGEEIGRQKWIDRQEKWHKSYKKTNYSKISQQLFWEIKERISEHCIFASYLQNDKNEEFVLRTKNGSAYKLDFYIPSKKKIIEFDGDYWHSVNKPGKISDEERDRYILETDDFKILHIKEQDFKNHKENTIKKCLNFINIS